MDAEAERINGKFKKGNYRPIVFLKKHHSHQEILPFYRLSDVCLVTSLHDGMNLVAKEFTAARNDENGVLILSRFAGASREMRDALIINPYDVDQMADAIRRALEMDPDEKSARMKRMRENSAENNIYRWAGNLIAELARLRLAEETPTPEAGVMNCVPGRRSLWVFDFDGALSWIVPDRNEARLHRGCERMLRFLARSPWNRVAVLSSRTLDDVVSRVPVPGVFVGGASGLEWRLPGSPDRTGRRLGNAPGGKAASRFPSFRRDRVRPGRGDRGQGVVRCDNMTRNTPPRSFRRRASLLQRLRNRKGIKVFREPRSWRCR